ncbi:MAG: pyridoxal-phosphate dependent enzyme [Solirubrobacterales bacterium]|nr:pyridoxal-phosphate dependent enzyme [Solirubrobacterales bacterium]
MSRGPSSGEAGQLEAPARAFHRSLPGYAPTPVHSLDAVAAQLGLGAVLVKDESNRFGLPAFKILGASWATDRALDEQPETHTLVAASAGNHGRAVARAAAWRGLRARIFLPARALPARREAIADEGAEVIVVDGTYEDAVASAKVAGEQAGVVEVADVGTSRPAQWVIEGYATLFAEAAEQAEVDTIVVPVGVGSLAAAAVRTGLPVIGVEPATAASLTASLRAGAPTAVPTPGTVMAGLDCAEVSPAAWPDLQRITDTMTISDEEALRACSEFDAHGLRIGECGAAPLAALRKLRGLQPGTRVLLMPPRAAPPSATLSRRRSVFT